MIGGVEPLTLLQTLCALPTAPFAESAVVRIITAWVAKRSGLSMQKDRDGNLLILRDGDPDLPRTVMVAHLDHPGFIAREMTGPKTLAADFHGYVKPEFFPGAKVRFFDGDAETAAVVEAVAAGTSDRADRAILRVRRAVAPGMVGMWDVGAGRVAGKRFYSRVCDDLAGVAAGLFAMQALSRKRLKASAALLLTRAEEEGFIGAIAAVRNKQLLKKTDRLISIECSAEQSYARQGDGMVIRTGDRTSIFHSAFTRFIGGRAEALAKADGSFKFQRALMPGGTCEATVFDAYGFTAAAVCIPLGNYHNMDTAAKTIAAENIRLDDWRNLTVLLTDVAANGYRFSGDHGELRERLSERHAKFAEMLRS